MLNFHLTNEKRVLYYTHNIKQKGNTMGTNYYVKTNDKVFKDGFDVDEILHVGKSSYGWYFSLHVIPERGINTLRDWLPILQNGVIHNEYGETISYENMLRTIKRDEDPEVGSWGIKPDINKENTHIEYSANSYSITYVGECGLHYCVIRENTVDLKKQLPLDTDIKGLYIYTTGDFS